MKIFRYENKHNGCGPFFTLSGINSADGKLYDNGGFLYACLSEEKCINLMSEYGIYGLKDYHIVEYEIPEKEVKIKGREVLFPKKYSPFI